MNATLVKRKKKPARATERHLDFLDRRIADAKFIGWPALAASWQADLDALLQAEPQSKLKH
jgi:hypothetical protein